MRIRTCLFFVAACIGLVVAGPSARAQDTATGAKLVRPESLEQGYILIVKDLSGLGGPASPIYLASNRNGWNPGDPAMRLEGRSDMRWQISLPGVADGSTMEFKFTRGSWDLCEVGEDLGDISNRTLPLVDASRLAPGEKAVIELTIPKFADQRPASQARRGVDPYRTLDVTGQVRRLQVVGGVPTGGARVREVLVWLPPGYDDAANAERLYPVLYLHDGQNVFEQLPGVPGEWRADETATELIEAGRIRPLIIVGIPHAGAERASEYLPVRAIEGVPARAEDHLEFLTREVMPRVERAFRVETGPEHTVVGGASLGAVISLYAATERPDLFGGVLAESIPTLSGAGGVWRSYLEGVTEWPRRVYVGMGGREAGTGSADDATNEAFIDWARSLDAMLAAEGLDESRRRLVIAPDAVHNEDAWADRLPGALEFLLPAR
jgi:enterochelin esterase-like enzyme